MCGNYVCISLLAKILGNFDYSVDVQHVLITNHPMHHQHKFTDLFLRMIEDIYTIWFGGGDLGL